MLLILGWLSIIIYFVTSFSKQTYSPMPGWSVVGMCLMTYYYQSAHFILPILMKVSFVCLFTFLLIGFLLVGYRRLVIQGLTLFNLFFVGVAVVGLGIPLCHVFLKYFNLSNEWFNLLSGYYYWIIIYIVLDYLHLMSTYVYYYLKSQRIVITHAPIVVLGCGLFNGTQLSPTLKQRVDLAIEKRLKETFLVMSGGQGPDEALPEARAMKYEAIKKGVPIERIITEETSTSTYENLKNTKELLGWDESYLNYIVSSNYHIPRALYYANQLNLNSIGLYAKSPIHLWCSMFFREWVAFILLRWRWHVLMFLLTSIFYLYFS